ncbi:MAG: helix-turn-helix domain-containing protein [Bacteroidia bacterium]|nr:helix-turn-helix domain-containing protein [Bacteroidia bacterium]
METLKYRLIKSKKQYAEYCTTLQALVTGNDKSKVTKDEVELLTLLIEKWNAEHNTFDEVDPITLLKNLMQEKKITSTELAGILNVSKGLISDIWNYKKGLSKEVIRGLANYFKVSHEAFNRAYDLKDQAKAQRVLA